jgi:hypothetical protein
MQILQGELAGTAFHEGLCSARDQPRTKVAKEKQRHRPMEQKQQAEFDSKLCKSQVKISNTDSLIRLYYPKMASSNTQAVTRTD